MKITFVQQIIGGYSNTREGIISNFLLSSVLNVLFASKQYN